SGLRRTYVKGNTQAGFTAINGIRSMPHIRREEYQPARLGLHQPLRCQSALGRVARLPELDPTGLQGRVLGLAWNLHIISRAQHAFWMEVIDVETVSFQAHRPGTGELRGPDIGATQRM